MIVLTVLLSSLFFVNTPAGARAVTSKIAACQHELAACATGSCRPQNLARQCPLNALRPRELRILQTELRSASARLKDLPASARQLCAEKADNAFTHALTEIEANWQGPNNPLGIPRTHLHGEDLETVYRARLDLQLTGNAGHAMAQKAEGASAGRFKACPQGPFLPVVLLRAQNLAFAHQHDFLRRLQNGGINRQILLAPYIIFLHADLWHPAQEEASRVFDALQEQGQFPAVPARNFHARVAAHKPLYQDDQLARGWPVCEGCKAAQP